MTYVTNIFAEYYPAIYKNSGFIEENVKKITKNGKKSLILMLTNQIQKGSLRLGNIRCLEHLTNKLSARFYHPQIFRNEDSTQRTPADTHRGEDISS